MFVVVKELHIKMSYKHFICPTLSTRSKIYICKQYLLFDLALLQIPVHLSFLGPPLRVKHVKLLETEQGINVLI